MKIIILVFLCLGVLLYLGMVGAMVSDRPKWVDTFYFSALVSEGVALMLLAVMEFLNS